jgi:hypothetical protein
MQGQLWTNRLKTFGTGFQPFKARLRLFPGASPQADIERALGASNSLFQLDLGANSAALKARCYTSLGRSPRIEATILRRAESPYQRF